MQQCFFIVLLFFSTEAEAVTYYTEGFFRYTVSNGQATVEVNDRGISGNVIIPSTLGGYPVTTIDNFATSGGAFENCSKMTSITIPASVTSIGKIAFSGCTNLTTVTILGNVTQIPFGAFRYCESLTTISAPNGFSSIGESAFYGCYSLTTIELSQSGASVGREAFYRCNSLKSVTGSVGVAVSAFELCESLTSVSISKGVTTIPSNMFRDCSSLPSIVIPEGVTYISGGAFWGCSSLNSISIPKSVTQIGGVAFYDCGSLNHVAYAGALEQWEEIYIGSDNTSLKDANRHYNTAFRQIDNCVETSIYCPACQTYLLRTIKTGGKHTYQSITDTSCDVCGTTRTLTAVSLAILPTKLQYNQYEDSLNVSGGQLRLTYNDGTSGTISMTSSMVSGFDNTVVGKQTLTVTYKDKSVTYQIEILAGVSSVEIASLPEKVSYLTGETLDLTGLTLLANYKDGRQKTIAATEVTAQADLTVAGVKTVAVIYQSVQTSFQIYVHEPKLETVDSSLYPESSHNYSNGANETKTLAVPGAVKLILTFNSSSVTESNYDYVYILDGSGNQIAKYSGSLANKVVAVPGDTVKIRLTSDSSVNKYGYAFSKIEVVLGALHPEVAVPGCAPTCTEKGLTDGAYCQICGQITKEQQTLPMLEHTYVYGKCTICGECTYYCIVLTEDAQVDLSLEEDLYVDLNGYDLTGTIITNGYKVYGTDSATDGYTCDSIGYFTCVDENGNFIVPERIYTEGEKQYMAICTEDRYSFHRFFVGTTHMSLEPEVVGLGYKAAIFGDEMVFAELAETKTFSFKLQLEGYNPVYRHFDSGELSSGDPITLRIRNYDVENYSEHTLYAQVSLTLSDGTVIEAEEVALTFRWLAEQVNENYTDYTADQLTSFKAMLQTFDIVKKWDIPNLI